MEQQERVARRLVWRRSKPVVIVALVIAIALSMAALIVLDHNRREALAQAESYRKQIALLEEEKEALNDKIAALGTRDGVQAIARDELGLVEPDAVILTPEQ